MKYKNDFEMNDNMQVIICPECRNEEFSPDSEFCRICGIQVYNKCDGEWDDRDQYKIEHNCPGNARFCEICGNPTYFAKKGYLKSWNEKPFNFESNDESSTQSELSED